MNVNPNFAWTPFYEEVADKLLTFSYRRNELISKIHELAPKVKGMPTLQDKYVDGTSGPLKDICPFTVIGLFNRPTTLQNRKATARELRKLLGVSASVPSSFIGIPLFNNQNAWLFSFSKDRNSSDIDLLWKVFAHAIAFSKSQDSITKSAFIDLYDRALEIRKVAWNLTIGLYWIRPWKFLALDYNSKNYIINKLHIPIKVTGTGKSGTGKYCQAADYLHLINSIEICFQESKYPFHSFPELSLEASRHKMGNDAVQSNADGQELFEEMPHTIPDIESASVPVEPYSADDIIEDGCFIRADGLERILSRLELKQNLILQGPPGTGKTWLARRLAYALIGQKDKERVRTVQFHPTLSYEDFIRGWRPTGAGKLILTNGHFMELIDVANRDLSAKHVMIIEEINRGNPAQIFGEMLTLLEKDKRSSDDALMLTYRRDDNERVFIPPNMYIIGTMNIADRSLALVDLALRRRFAFIDLKPEFNDLWYDWAQTKCGISVEALDIIKERMVSLNKDISNDSSLGPQFQVGHSFVTPSAEDEIDDGEKWFLQIVQTEIGPLLNEYWADTPGKADDAIKRLAMPF